MTPTFAIVLYALIPTACALLGGAIATFYTPKPKFVSCLQHFVAGVVLAAVSIELLPKIVDKGWTVTIGFIAGVLVMLLVQGFGTKGGLVLGGALDLLIDGVLIGVSFLAGRASGLLIALSLSLCAFFLNLTLASTLKKKKISAIIFVALMLPVGAFIGGSVLSFFPATIMTETLAFGVAALLYLGVEELIKEAHEQRDTTWISAFFFLGFLTLLLFKV